jgi:hypothetical protein
VRDRISAGLILTLGLCLATGAFTLWAIQATALTEGPLGRDAGAMLDQPPVRRAMASRVAAAIAIQIPAGTAVDPAVLAEVADRTLEQPAFVAAFGGALDQVQAHVVDGAVNPITLDPVLVAQAAGAAGADRPELAPALASGSSLLVSVPDDEIPDLARWADLWEAVTRALAFFALVLITYGALRVDHRAWAVGRICRWAICVGVATLAIFWALPFGLGALGGWIGVGGVVLGANRSLVPLALLLVTGGGLGVYAVHRWEAHDRRRVLAAVPGPSTRAGATASGPWESRV